MVYRQIMDCSAELGGFGHPLFIGRSGFPIRAGAKKSIRPSAAKVPPRLNESPPTVAA